MYAGGTARDETLETDLLTEVERIAGRDNGEWYFEPVLRDGRLLFANPAFMRAAGREGQAPPTYPTDLVVQEDKGPLSDAIRRFAQGPATSGDIAVRLSAQAEDPVSLSLAGVRGLGDAAVLLGLTDSSEETRLK
mgnify:CR=1 FL=1